MNGIQSGMARHLNRHWNRRGKVFAHRYHVKAIHAPTQCHNALVYVLHNAKNHGVRPLDSGIEPYSTAAWFPFDCPEPPHPLSSFPKPAASPRSWLLRRGWSQFGLLTSHDHPRIPPGPARLLPLTVAIARSPRPSGADDRDGEG